MKRILAAIAVFLPCAIAAQDGPARVWELAHPDAKLLVGIDVRALKASTFADAFRAQTNGQDAGGAPSAPLPSPFSGAMKLHFPGMELLTDIDRVLISSTGIRAPGSTQNPPFLLVLEGTFPAEHYKPLLQGEKRTYRTVPVYRMSKANDPSNTSIAIAGEHVILLGDERSVFSALDRRGRALAFGGTAPNPLLARAAELAASNDVWVIASDLRSSLPPSQAGLGAMASEVEGLEVALSVRDGLALNANVATRTEAAAQMFANLVSMQLAAETAKIADPRAAQLAQKLQIGARGNRLELHVALTKAEVEQQIQLAREARMKGPARASLSGNSEPPSFAAPPAPAQPAGPRKIRIYGLDEGVKEIPLDRP